VIEAPPPTSEVAGNLEGQDIRAFTLSNGCGMSVRILEYGAILQTIHVPDARRAIDNVALGFRNLDEYVADHSYFGAIVGRFANRIENGEFSLDGHVYHITVNDPPTSVHGGASGFNDKVWKGTPFSTSHSSGVRMHYTSPAGEEGFPGTLNVEVVYELLGEENTLRVEYRATTDQPTIINLTNHSFFNLGGEGNGNVLGHLVTIDADSYLPLTAQMTPIGVISAVADTPMDFRTPHRIGARMQDGYEQLALVGGYDHNYVLRPHGSELVRAVRVTAPNSGRTLEVWTTEPAVDFYTGNMFDGSIIGYSGGAYLSHAGVAIEPEHVSNSPNLASFPSTTLRPGDAYHSVTELRFGIQKF
jgi:aldose 1-epimerase